MVKKTFFLLALFFSLAIIAAPLKEAKAAGRLYLDPASGSYKVNDEFTLSVKVDPSGTEIVAIDGVINYDSSRLEVLSVTGEDYFVQTGAGKNQEFMSDIDKENGRIKLYSFATISNFSVKTAGKIASIKFKAKSQGTATATFVCQAGGKEDTNIWDVAAADVIDCASNGAGSYVISTADNNSPTSTPTPTPTGTPAAAATATPTGLPNTGIETPLIGVLVVGALVIGAGLFIGIL